MTHICCTAYIPFSSIIPQFIYSRYGTIPNSNSNPDPNSNPDHNVRYCEICGLQCIDQCDTCGQCKICCSDIRETAIWLHLQGRLMPYLSHSNNAE